MTKRAGGVELCPDDWPPLEAPPQAETKAIDAVATAARTRPPRLRPVLGASIADAESVVSRSDPERFDVSGRFQRAVSGIPRTLPSRDRPRASRRWDGC